MTYERKRAGSVTNSTFTNQVKSGGVIPASALQFSIDRRKEGLGLIRKYHLFPESWLWEYCYRNFSFNRNKRNSCNLLHRSPVWGTNIPKKLSNILPGTEIVPHLFSGKYLYWLPLGKRGDEKANRLGLKKKYIPKTKCQIEL